MHSITRSDDLFDIPDDLNTAKRDDKFGLFFRLFCVWPHFAKQISWLHLSAPSPFLHHSHAPHLQWEHIFTQLACNPNQPWLRLFTPHPFPRHHDLHLLHLPSKCNLILMTNTLVNDNAFEICRLCP